jgi:hypothetical protein
MQFRSSYAGLTRVSMLISGPWKGCGETGEAKGGTDRRVKPGGDAHWMKREKPLRDMTFIAANESF